MERFVVWVVLAALYGGALAVLYQFMGQGGVAVWLALVVAFQWWLRQRAKGY